MKIEFNNIRIIARLLSNKLIRAKNTLDKLLKIIKISYNKLKLIVKFLLFIIKIVILERIFLRRLFDVI